MSLCAIEKRDEKPAARISIRKLQRYLPLLSRTSLLTSVIPSNLLCLCSNSGTEFYIYDGRKGACT